MSVDSLERNSTCEQVEAIPSEASTKSATGLGSASPEEYVRSLPAVAEVSIEPASESCVSKAMDIKEWELALNCMMEGVDKCYIYLLHWLDSREKVVVWAQLSQVCQD